MKIDRNGFECYDKLPDGYRLATINDFHDNGRKNIGMEFLILRVTKEIYDVYHLSDHHTGSWLNEFIKDKRVFIKE
jgi:hypothetical protein